MNSTNLVGAAWSRVSTEALVEALAEAAVMVTQGFALPLAIRRVPLGLRIHTQGERAEHDAAARLLVRTSGICSRLGFTQAMRIAATMEPHQPISREKMALAVVHTMNCRLDADAVLRSFVASGETTESMQRGISEMLDSIEAGWARGAAMFSDGVDVKKTPLDRLGDGQVWALTADELGDVVRGGLGLGRVVALPEFFTARLDQMTVDRDAHIDRTTTEEVTP